MRLGGRTAQGPATRAYLPAPTLRPASDNESSAPLVEAVPPPQWVMNAVMDRHSAPATVPAPSVGVGARPGAAERVKRGGDARNWGPAPQADGILTRVEGFESVVDSPLPSGESDTS